MYIVEVRGVYPTYDATPEPTLAHMLMVNQGEMIDYKELERDRPDKTPFRAEVHLNQYDAEEWLKDRLSTLLLKRVSGKANVPFPNQVEVNNFILKHRAKGRA
jgi:hypothetical protein